MRAIFVPILIVCIMKKLGSVIEFTRQRNDDLMRAYRIQLALVPHIVMSRLFELVALSPSTRFWVTEERAAHIVSLMLEDKPLPYMRDNRREMFEEIYRRFLSERRRRPHASLHALVCDIVCGPAPKFYLTPRTVGEIIYRIRNGWYDRH